MNGTRQPKGLPVFPRVEVLGKDLVSEFITDEYKAPVKQVLDNALLGHETANYEFPLYTKTSQRVDVLLNATTRRDVERSDYRGHRCWARYY